MDLSCLLCVASIAVSGSLGMQFNEDTPYDLRSNHYSQNIGIAELVVEFENGLIVQATHLSGVDSSEVDHGINSISIGARIYLYER